MDYAPNTQAQLDEMLQTIGVTSFEELLDTVPPDLLNRELNIPSGLAESSVLELCEKIASKNRSVDSTPSFLGAGSYNHVVPTVVDSISARGEWLTPYTPYQAEASQGTLQAVYEFQTMICQLMQMEVSNASLYDGASSVAEAAVLALRVSGRGRVLISEGLHPHAREVVATYLGGANAVIQQIPTVNGVTDLEALSKAIRDDVACVILQHPNVFGCLEPMQQASEITHNFGGLFVSSVYPISLGLLQPPGSYGADIAVAEGRCLGSPLAYGGPGLGLFTTTQQLLRRIPGRLAGCTVDGKGARSYTLTLQTREQHIRRERATSNICTNEGWLALRATLFLSMLGKRGMQDLAKQNFDKAHYALARLSEIPWINIAFDQPFFNEFTLKFDEAISVDRVNSELAKAGFIGGFPLKDWFPTLPNSALWCVTELVSRQKIDAAVETLRRLL